MLADQLDYVVGVDPSEQGRGLMRNTIAAVNALEISQGEKEQIFSCNGKPVVYIRDYAAITCFPVTFKSKRNRVYSSHGWFSVSTG